METTQMNTGKIRVSVGRRSIRHLVSLVLLLGTVGNVHAQWWPPYTIYYDDGLCGYVDTRRNSFIMVYFETQPSFTLESVNFMVINESGSSEGCHIFIEDYTTPGCPIHLGYVPGPLPHGTWIRHDLTAWGGGGWMIQENKFCIFIQQPGGVYPDEGPWVAIDDGTTTYQTHISDGTNWYNCTYGDAMIRAEGRYYDPVPPKGETYCLWISADKDTYVWAERPDSEFGREGYLPVAYLGSLKRSFVHYHLPQLPPGTQIDEAYMELYHPARNGDGTTDNINIRVHRASRDWNPHTLTWNNAEPYTQACEFRIQLRSQAWCGSDMIKQFIEPMFRNPNNNHGFVLHYSGYANRGIEKAFYSNNYTRTLDRRAPRLLVKITLPAGKTINDVIVPPLPWDTDLNTSPGSEPGMLRSNPGKDWPDEWNVVAAE
ncbi:DNRLRE domain-containing protein [Planctomycetota bacterium]